MLQPSPELKACALRLNFFQNETGKTILIGRGRERFLTNGLIVANNTRESEASRPASAFACSNTPR